MYLIFRIFLNSFEISVKFCVVFTPVLKFCEDKVFRSIKTFLSPIRKTAQNFEKHVIQNCVRITLYTRIYL
jgi:hypothetical protein